MKTKILRFAEAMAVHTALSALGPVNVRVELRFSNPYRTVVCGGLKVTIREYGAAPSTETYPNRLAFAESYGVPTVSGYQVGARP